MALRLRNRLNKKKKSSCQYKWKKVKQMNQECNFIFYSAELIQEIIHSFPKSHPPVNHRKDGRRSRNLKVQCVSSNCKIRQINLTAKLFNSRCSFTLLGELRKWLF